VFHTYILLCADNTFYIGSCENLTDRVATHMRGEGATWTAKRLPVRLVYSEEHSTRAAAAARERQIKRWSRAKKVALIEGDRDGLRMLSKSRE